MEFNIENTAFITSKRNIVLDPLADFKCMYISDLFDKQKDLYGKSKQGFYRLINRMELDGLLKTVGGLENNRKIVFLTQVGSSLLDKDFVNFPSKEALRHDAIVSSIVLDILKKIKSYTYEIPNSFDGSGLVPDARCWLDIDNEKSLFHIELELTRKSKERQIAKMKNYLQLKDKSFVIYFFDKKGVFNSYKESLNHTLIDLDIDEKKSRIILCYSPMLSSSDQCILDSDIYTQGQNAKLRDIFYA